MDFIGPFYDYFIAKHGIDAFNEIKDMILSKIQSFRYQIKENMAEEEFYKVYIIYVFEIALADYWGMNDTQISKYVRSVMTNKTISKINVSRIKMIHFNAISLIQSYLQQNENEVREALNNGKGKNN